MVWRLPIDVIEEIIDMLGATRDVGTLRNTALVCRSLLSHSRTHLFSAVLVDSTASTYALHDFVSETPLFQNAVRSITVRQQYSYQPGLLETVPIPLLSTLPNLREWRWEGDDGALDEEVPFPIPKFYHVGKRRWRDHDEKAISVHPTMFLRIRAHLAHLDTLHLINVWLVSCAEFARLLLALPNLRHLHLATVSTKNGGVVSDALRTRMFMGLRLTSLRLDDGVDKDIMDVVFRIQPWMLDDLRVAFDPSSVLRHDFSQVDSLAALFPHVNLSLFKLELFLLDSNATYFKRSLDAPTADGVVRLLRQLTSSNCTHLVVQIHLLSPTAEIDDPDDRQHRRFKPWADTEQAMLDSAIEQITFVLGGIRRNRFAFWRWILNQVFPSLARSPKATIEITCRDRKGDPLPCGHPDAVSAAAISPDSRWIATTSASSVILWNSTGQHVREWFFTPLPAADVPASLDPTLVIIPECSGLSCLASTLTFSPNLEHPRLAVPSTDNAIYILDVCDGTHITTLRSDSEARACVWCPDGRRLASAHDRLIRVWHIRSPGTQKTKVDPDPPICLAISDPPAQLCAFVFPRDGRQVAYASTAAGSYHVWDVATAVKQREARMMLPDGPGSICAVAMDPTGTRVAFAAKDGISIWDEDVGQTRKLVGFHGSLQLVRIFFCNERDTGVLVCIALIDRVVHVWSWDTPDFSSGRNSPSVWALNISLTSLVASSDKGRYVAVAGEADNIVQLYQTKDGELLMTFREHEQPVTHLMFSPDEENLVSASSDGSVVIRCIRHHVLLP